MRDLLRAARAKLAAEGLADRYRIGITSAYRPATRQFEIWQGRTFAGKSTGGGFPYYYEKSIENGLVREGDYSRAAAKKFVEFFGGCIASPGYSNHQDGLAFDLGTGLVGKGLGKIGSGSWFHRWLEENARGFHFYPLSTEAWHWTFHPPSGASRRRGRCRSRRASRPAALEVEKVPLLARHRGRSPDLILRWNDMPAVPEQIDVAVHLHGFWYPYLRLPKDIEPVSGLDLAPTEGAAGQGRTRRRSRCCRERHYTGVKQTLGSYYAYTFPALVTKDGLHRPRPVLARPFRRRGRRLRAAPRPPDPHRALGRRQGAARHPPFPRPRPDPRLRRALLGAGPRWPSGRSGTSPPTAPRAARRTAPSASSTRIARSAARARPASTCARRSSRSSAVGSSASTA